MTMTTNVNYNDPAMIALQRQRFEEFLKSNLFPGSYATGEDLFNCFPYDPLNTFAETVKSEMLSGSLTPGSICNSVLSDLKCFVADLELTLASIERDA